MRIAFVTSEFVSEESFAGGLANYVYRTAKMLRSMGHDAVVITCSGAGGEIEYDGIPVYRVAVKDSVSWKTPAWLETLDRLTSHRYTVFLRSYWQSRQLNKRLKTLHAKQRFDVVQFAHLEGVGYCMPRNIPSVIRLSSATRLCQELGGYGAKDRELRQQEYLEKLAMEKADAVFGPSKQIAAYVGTFLNKDISIIETPFVYDVDQLDPSIYQQCCANKKYLLFFGSIGLIKGAGTIADMIHDLLSRYEDLHFVFVGNRVKQQEGGEVMERIWHNAGRHQHRVVYHPAVPHSQLYPIIEHAHTVVLPSRIDNFPNACIEAMAHSKVVIGTKGNGFEQLIEHGKSGLLCNPDDPADLLRVTDLALLLTDEERQTIGANAKKRIADLSPEKVGQQLVELYESVR